MLNDFDGQILGVTGRTVGGGRTIYDVAFSNGKSYATFDPNLAQQAQGMANQAVSIRVETTQKPGKNGQLYTNENIVALAAQGQLPFMPPQISGGAIPMAGPPAGIPISSGGGGGMSPEDKARLTRLSAASSAFGFVGALLDGAGPEAAQVGLGLARQLTEEINGYGMSGQWSSGIQPTPLGVASGVPGVQVGTAGIGPSGQAEVVNPTTGNDIPWGQPQQ